MTRSSKPKRRLARATAAGPVRPRAGSWMLQDAKARFSELARRVRSEGPQHVLVHERYEVVVIAAEDFRRLKGDLTDQALLDAMRTPPHRDY